MGCKSSSKWFGGGHGHVSRYPGSDTLLFQWSGKSDGTARYIPHVKRYARRGVEHRSLAALLRSVAAEHAPAASEPTPKDDPLDDFNYVGSRHHY